LTSMRTKAGIATAAALSVIAIGALAPAGDAASGVCGSDSGSGGTGATGSGSSCKSGKYVNPFKHQSWYAGRIDIGLFTVMARLTSDDVMARVFGLLESVIALSVGTGAILTPVAIDLLGLRPALVVVGLLGPALVALAWRRLRHLDTSLAGRDREIGQLRAVAMFRPVPMPEFLE